MSGPLRALTVFALFSVTACAPVVYDASHYHRHQPAPGYVAIQASYKSPVHEHRIVHQAYHPIEIELYPDHTFIDVQFHPVRLVFYDGDVVEIPLRKRIGQASRVYAHYHLGELHFDRDRNCNRIYDLPRYQYDKSWENGRKYGHFKTARKYGLDGFGVEIRKHVKDRPHQARKHKHQHSKDSLKRLTRAGKAPVKDDVTTDRYKIKTVVKTPQRDKVAKRNVNRIEKQIVVKGKKTDNKKLEKPAGKATAKDVKRSIVTKGPKRNIHKSNSFVSQKINTMRDSIENSGERKKKVTQNKKDQKRKKVNNGATNRLVKKKSAKNDKGMGNTEEKQENGKEGIKEQAQSTAKKRSITQLHDKVRTP